MAGKGLEFGAPRYRNDTPLCYGCYNNSIMQADFLSSLYKTLNERQRPEDIAQLILEHRVGLSSLERDALERVAKRSLKSTLTGWFSSMSVTFKEPHGMRRQLNKAEELFHKSFSKDESDFIDANKIEAYIQELSETIGKIVGKSNYKDDRLSSEERKKQHLDLSRRQYNKLFRHLGRLEAKLHTLLREQQKLRFTKISKASLASEIEWEDFSKDVPTACFVAYYAARAYRRSVFTAYGQEKAYDEIADVLYKEAIKGASADWWVIAHVYPSQEVIGNLTDEQKGVLLGKWTNIIEDIASLLEEVWNRSNINRETMIVRKGNDSSTWNQAAGAWNKARDSWMSLIYGLGMEEVLYEVCFGKVMRLMAADVAAWHRLEGGDIDADTKVWNEIALPWQVFKREVKCSMSEVRSSCTKYGINPEESGWITPRPRTHVEAYKPTPELVHGVAVESPFLAGILKDAGFFSGKASKSREAGGFEASAELHSEILEEHRRNLNFSKG